MVRREASKSIKKCRSGAAASSGRWDGDAGCGRRRKRGGGWWTKPGDGDEVGRPRDGSKRRAALTDLSVARRQTEASESPRAPPSLPPSGGQGSNPKFLPFLTCLTQIYAPAPAANPRASPMQKKKTLNRIRTPRNGRERGG